MPGRYLFDRIPLNGAILLTIELLLVLRLTYIYIDHVKSHPILTTVVCNSLLGSVSDTVAQLLTLAQSRRNNKRIGKDISLDAIREEYQLPIQAQQAMLSGAERVFDIDRLVRFVSYSFVSAPLQYEWYASLDSWFPVGGSVLGRPSGQSAVMKRLLADQLLYAPASLLLFFAIMELLQANGLGGLKKRLKNHYWPALKAQYVLWPLVQLLNFKFVPLEFQVPLVSSVSVGWNIYLSIMLGSRR